MAIDTRAKRQSVPQHLVSMTGPPPTGTIGTSAREHITWLYSGITPFAPVGGSTVFSQNPHASRSST